MNNLKVAKNTFIQVSIILILNLATQHQSIAQDSIPKNSISDIWKKSKFELKNRTFYMRTQNADFLKTDDALANAVSFNYKTGIYKGFSLEIGAMWNNKIYSTNLSKTDEVTSQNNRYEIGLFDITNAKNEYNLTRIENLNLKYDFKKSVISLGRVKLNTPFLNPQDGRMNATMEEGISLKSKLIQKLTFDIGWYWGISPRSSNKWYAISKSFGLYPMGVTSDGKKGNYANNIQSDGILLGNIQYEMNKNIQLQVHNLLVTNIFNTSQLEIKSTWGANQQYFANAMYIHQNAVNNGGNENQNLSYFDKNSQSNVISAQIGLKIKKWKQSFNYTTITKDGKYLMPREWGRDPFYTFMPRERNEGFGGVNAFVYKSDFQLNKFKTGLSYGYFNLPDVKNYRLNKYGMPSYHQINLEINYNAKKLLKGLNTKLLIAYKIKEGDIYHNFKYQYNKVDMANINLVLDLNIF